LISCCDKKQVMSFIFRFIWCHSCMRDTLQTAVILLSNQGTVVEPFTLLQIQQIHSCSSAAVRSLLRELVQLHDTSYKYTGIA
jgi:hypothetical protein